MEVKPVQLHHLHPCLHEVLNKALSAVCLGIDLHNRPQLAIGSKDKVSAGCRPAQAAISPVTALVEISVRTRAPCRVHIEQIDEEIRAQHANSIGEDAMTAAATVGAEHPQTSHENREFRRAQSQLLGPIEEKFLGSNRQIGPLPIAEAIAKGFEPIESGGVSLLSARIGATRAEGNSHIGSNRRCRLLYGRTSGQHDQIGQGDDFAVRAVAVECCLNILQLGQNP